MNIIWAISLESTFKAHNLAGFYKLVILWLQIKISRIRFIALQKIQVPYLMSVYKLLKKTVSTCFYKPKMHTNKNCDASRVFCAKFHYQES